MTSELTEESEPIESKKEEDPKATIPASSEPLKEEEAPKSEEGEEKSDVAEDNEWKKSLICVKLLHLFFLSVINIISAFISLLFLIKM